MAMKVRKVNWGMKTENYAKCMKIKPRVLNHKNQPQTEIKPV